MACPGNNQSSHFWCFGNQTSFPFLAQDSGESLILQAAMPPLIWWSPQTRDTQQTGWEVEQSIMSLGFSQEWKQFTGGPLIWKILPVATSSKGANATTFFTYRLTQEGLLIIFLLIDRFVDFSTERNYRSHGSWLKSQNLSYAELSGIIMQLPRLRFLASNESSDFELGSVWKTFLESKWEVNGY